MASEIDAAELARLRNTTNQAVLRMREAESKVAASKGAATRARNDRTIAINERNSARALLRECAGRLSTIVHRNDAEAELAFRARVAKEIGQ